MKFVWQYLKKHLQKVIIATLMSFISGASLIFILKTFHGAIKEGIDDLTFLFTKIGISLISYFVFGIVSDKIMFGVSHITVMDMRMDLCRLIFNSTYENIENKKQELVTSLVSDINALSRIIDRIPTTSQSIIVSVAGIGYLFFISWKLSILLMAVLGIIYLIIKIRNPKVYKLTQNSRQSWDKVYHHLHDIIFGIKELTLNAFKKGTYIDHYLRMSSEKEVYDKSALRYYNQIGSKLSEITLLIGVCVLIASSIFLPEVTTTTIAEFLTISLFVITPITTVSNFIKEMIPLKAITDHIITLGIDLNRHQLSLKNESVKSPAEIIKLQDIEYKYQNLDDFNFKLGPVNFDIPAGMITIIYGSNGSGKTTLAKVLAGLYLPSDGSIIWNESKINQNNLESYRSRISAVFSDNHLFRNYRIKEEQKSQFGLLLDIFQIKEKVKIENEEVNSSGLSTGQGKRLALVMSLLEEKQIYIFDEWAANQDPQFKKAFYHMLLPELKKRGKTVILITHDDQYFNVADHKVHLIEGKVSGDESL